MICIKSETKEDEQAVRQLAACLVFRKKGKNMNRKRVNERRRKEIEEIFDDSFI